MRPFEFIILFCSFGYVLALTHIFFAVTRMIRHRRVLVFCWAHAMWMAFALTLAVSNWFTLWDLHTMEVMSLPVICVVLGIVTVQYFVCALVAPDFEDGESYDMCAFHAREGRTYIGAALVLFVYSIMANFWVGSAYGVQSWAEQNLWLFAAFPFLILPIFVRNAWAQVVSPLVLIALVIGVIAAYYPALR